MHRNFKSNKILLILCSIIAVLLIFTAVIFGAYKINAIRYDEMMALELPDWQGVINIWHIDSFRTPNAGKAAALRSIATLFEKKHRGVFVEIEEITPEEYEKRIADGGSPDIVSFPAEMSIDLTNSTQITAAPGLMPIHELCQNLCSFKASPWLWTMPMAVINEEFTMKMDITLKTNPGIEEFGDALAQITESSGRGVAANEYALTSFLLSELQLSILKPMTCWQAWQSFAQKESCIVFGGLWEIAAMERLNERNKGFGISVVQIPEGVPGFCWTQWLSIKSQDEKCVEYARKLIDMLLLPEIQKKLADSTGCLSVLSGQADYQGYRKDAYFRKGNLIALIPGGSLEAGAVYQALGGDGLAKASVMSRLTVIENTNTQARLSEDTGP